MSWLERISIKESESCATGEPSTDEQQMSPGLTGEYDWELREKAGMHSPPPPPEFMGVEGEYDSAGLAKRVAIALDQDPMVQDITTLHIVQRGGAIALKGHLADSGILERIVQIASQVDGTTHVDTQEAVVQPD